MTRSIAGAPLPRPPEGYGDGQSWGEALYGIFRPRGVGIIDTPTGPQVVLLIDPDGTPPLVMALDQADLAAITEMAAHAARLVSDA